MDQVGVQETRLAGLVQESEAGLAEKKSGISFSIHRSRKCS